MRRHQADVALAGRITVAGAVIVFDVVPVITGFVACLPLCDVLAHDAVAADRSNAAVSAAVGVDLVGVIAGFIAFIAFA
jgi:uncharacterized membrane protein (GlpM family)